MRVWLQKTLVRWAMRLDKEDADVLPSVSFEAAATRTIRARQPAREPVDAKLAPDPVEAPAGYRQMLPSGQMPSPLGTALLLTARDAEVFVPIFVGPSEALAFKHRLAGQAYARPLAHDLFDRLLALCGGRICEVRIEQLRADSFVANVVLSLAEGNTTSLDARASDAIILAMGAAVPIFVADAVVARTGRPLRDLAQG